MSHDDLRCAKNTTKMRTNAKKWPKTPPKDVQQGRPRSKDVAKLRPRGVQVAFKRSKRRPAGPKSVPRAFRKRPRAPQKLPRAPEKPPRAIREWPKSARGTPNEQQRYAFYAFLCFPMFCGVFYFLGRLHPFFAFWVVVLCLSNEVIPDPGIFPSCVQEASKLRPRVGIQL